MASRGKAFIFTVACFGAAIGCGGRTDTLFDDGSGFGGFNAAGRGQGGSSSVAGNTGHGGFGIGGSAIAGGFGLGGATPTGGGHSGGAAAGGVSFGGFGNVGNFAGSLAFGGSGAIGGEAGAGGTGGIVELCVAAAPTACDKCLCQGCGSELTACFSDIGCALIFACVQQKQCQGFNCYQNSTCRGVIDQFGGLTGPSVSEVFSLASCSVTARANCGCN